MTDRLQPILCYNTLGKTDRLQIMKDQIFQIAEKNLLISENESKISISNRCNSVAGLFVQFIRLVIALEYNGFSHSHSICIFSFNPYDPVLANVSYEQWVVSLLFLEFF